jgi:hypothetical protein
MSKHLIIVESPAKAKTLEKFLGRDFTVLASYGHVRDLVPKEGAVDPANDFAMRYEVIDKNQRHVDAIARALKKADALYLATDPDREGEAISWHLYEILKDRDLLNGKPVHRVVFHEITRGAIEDAIQHPRELSDDLVDAQQARRALDYLVGFNLSPLLWKKIKRGLSAGRVQSPALRHREVRPARVLDDRCSGPRRRPRFPGPTVPTARAEGRAVHDHGWRYGRGRREAPPRGGGRQPDRLHGQQEAAPAQPGRALHDLHASAGRIAQARIHGPAHHARRPASLRGCRCR